MKSKARKNEYPLHNILDLVSKGNLQEIKRVVFLERSLIHEQDENGITLLIEAVNSGHFEIVKFLVEMGSDVNCIDLEGSCPLLYAADKENRKIFDYLFNLTERELKEASLYIATIDGKIETLKALVARQVNVDTFRMKGVWGDQGFTALIAVVEQGDEELVEIVEMLLDAGADINLPEEDTGGTALMYAAKRGGLPILRLLLEAGVDPHLKDDSGETALMKAEKLGKNEIVEVLRQYLERT